MNDAESKRSRIPGIAMGVGAVVAMTLASGIAHGYLDGRWAANTDLLAHGAKIKELPEKCGPWTLVEASDLNESAAELLRSYGSTIREYVNGETGDHVNVAVLFGPRGPTAIHIPEICFDSIGTSQFGERVKVPMDIDGTRHDFWAVMFSRDESPEPTIDVWYAWSDGAEWQASNYPRFWMTDNLYKVQASGPVGDGKDNRPCRDFLTHFVPQLERLKHPE